MISHSEEQCSNEQIGESAMIVIDSVTCEYEKIYGKEDGGCDD